MARSSLLRRMRARLNARAPEDGWPAGGAGKDRPDQEADAAQLADLGYEPSVNQVRHEPLPASHHAEQRQEAVVRNEELGSAAGADRPLDPPRGTSDDSDTRG